MVQLTALEIHGFKSFADRLELHFNPGITAIVGPNGSGKSNIVDAIRWVLGEQSARELRGTRMEDVIFAGSERRRALGVAEVSLLLDNASLDLGLDYTEVRLTRRVDRAGGSEYLVNRSPWRLKDLRELLFGTGLGRDSYALIGQGEIDRILLSRPEDRRLLFEEAASITRYKARQQEALNRLDDVRERRSRLQLMVEELDRRLEPLAQEAERATQYTELQDQLEQREALLHISTYYQALERLEGQQALIRGMRDRMERLTEQRQVAASELQRYRNEFEESGGGFEALRRDIKTLEERRERQHTTLELAREQGRQHQRELERVHAHAADLGEQLERWETDHERRQVEVRAYEAEVAAARDELVARSGEKAELALRVQRLESERSETERAVRDVREREQQEATALSGVQQQVDSLTRERDGLEQRVATGVDELRQLATQRASLEADLEETLNEQREAERRGRELTSTVGELEQDRKRLGDRLADLNSRRDKTESRITTLQEVEDAYEGYYQGVRSVLRARDQGHPAAAGVIGAISEVIHVAADYEEAIEVALGGGLQNIVTMDGRSAQQAIEYLKEHRGGRATFLPIPDLTNRRRPSLRDLVETEDVVGWAADLVESPADCQPAVEYLLGRTLVVKTLPAARHHARKAPGVRIVTLDGELLLPGGSVTGGKGSSGRAGPGLLARRRELSELSETLVTVKNAQQEVRERLVDVEHRLADARAEVETVRSRFIELRSRSRSLEMEKSRVQERQSELETLRKSLSSSLEVATSRLSSVHERLAELTAGHDASVNNLHVAEQRLARVAEQLAAVSARRTQLQAEVQGLTLRVQDREDQVERLHTWLQQETQRREELLQQLASARTEESRLHDEVQSAGRRLDELNVGLQRLEDELAGLQESWEQRQQERRELATRVVELQDRLDDISQQREEVTSTLHEEELKLARWEVELETAESTLREQAGLDPGTERKRLAQALEADTVLRDTDELARLQREVRSLKRKLGALGAVNPSAVEEYREVRERHDRLYFYWDQLERGEAALYRLARHIDEAMQRVFRRTFDTVRKEFRQVFTALFGGGSADIVLVGEGDIWQRGVDIIAQAPGKKFQQISLLSGGERALTAIALLFAFIHSNPTPFVVMDEIDAALDDANLDKFARFLRAAATMNQFIVVTHQKRTMEEADVLYGVTMGDEGTSRTVSVKLSAAEQMVAQE